MKFPTVTAGQLVFIVIAVLVALFLPLPVLGIVLVLLGVFGRYFGINPMWRILLVLIGIVLILLAAFIVVAIFTMFGG